MDQSIEEQLESTKLAYLQLQGQRADYTRMMIEKTTEIDGLKSLNKLLVASLEDAQYLIRRLRKTTTPFE